MLILVECLFSYSIELKLFEMKNIFYLALVVLLSINFSCSHYFQQKKMNLLKIEYKQEIKIDTTTFDLFFNSNLDYNLSRLSFREIDGYTYFAGLNLKGDSIIIFQADSNVLVRTENPLKGLPIISFYFHNIDSIFIFLDRFFINDFKNQKNKTIPDFFLINRDGKIVNNFSLDSVPNIDNQNNDNRISIDKMSANVNRVEKGKLYIPFYIFKPLMNFKNEKTSLICEYDLHYKTIRMLNIYVHEDKYIESSTMNISYFFPKTGELIYSFKHTPTIYKFDLSMNTPNKIIYTKDLVGSNYLDSSYLVEYDEIQYASKDKKALRRITVTNELNKQKIYFLELLDSNYSNIGYYLSSPNTINPFIDNGVIVCRIPDNYGLNRIFRIDFTDSSSTTLSRLFTDHSSFNNTSFDPNKSESSYKERIVNYLLEIGIKEGEKVVLIKYDQTCGNSISFLINEINKNKVAKSDSSLRIVLISEDLRELTLLKKQYSQLGNAIIYDNNKLFASYFHENEYDLNLMTIIGNGKLIYYQKYDCIDVEKCYKTLIKIGNK